MEFHSSGQVHYVIHFRLGKKVADLKCTWGTRKDLERHVQHRLWTAILLQQPRLGILQDALTSDLIDVTQLVIMRHVNVMCLPSGDPVFLAKVISPPNLMRGCIPGVNRQIFPPCEVEVLLAKVTTVHVFLIRLELRMRQFVQVCLGCLRIPLDGYRIIVIHGLGRLHDESRQYDRLVRRRGQIECMTRKARRPRRIERTHHAHRRSGAAVVRVPEESDALRAHVDEFGGPSVEVRPSRHPRARRFAVEFAHVRLGVRAEFLRAVSEVEVHGANGRIVAKLLLREGALRGFR
mmetsp:Transcript_21778/g.52660  ORF Transcript_21778/g.52660 Transcript_21778/m.52660 type:complete len:292 (-) Transcript_21778:217-1092(-)